jgi:hypothetical protein
MKNSAETASKKSKPSARELREKNRARAEQRKRLVWGGIGIAAFAVIAVVVYLVATAPPPVQIEGLQIFPNIPGGQHASGPIGYAQTPPVGGPHDPDWQNCGIYDRAVRAEYAVHSMEHGAVWLTYAPDLPAEEVQILQSIARANRYVLLSPFEGLPTPVVASAWQAQLQLPDASDARLAEFVRRFQTGPYTPEPGAPCTGGFGSPIG